MRPVSEARAVTVESHETADRGDRREPPLLLFFTRRTSGSSRRMQSLVAWVKVTHKRTLRVVEVDADDEVGLAERLSVATGRRRSSW